MRTITLSLMAFACIACVHSKSPSTQVQEVQEPKEQAFFMHRVKSNSETLKSIAKWYTGDEKNISKLISATPGLADGKIKAGESILIPEELVVTHEVMPKNNRTNVTQKVVSRAKNSNNQDSQSTSIKEFSPNAPQPAAVIGIYRFDQLPTPKGETPESLHRLFSEGKGGEEARRAQLHRELLEE